jgi:hypothetical protein
MESALLAAGLITAAASVAIVLIMQAVHSRKLKQQ